MATQRRSSYTKGALERADLLAEPSRQLERWLQDAQEAETTEPTAMCLATVGKDGKPSSRMVLLQAVDTDGLRFFSNYDSHKGRELAANPYAALCFWWGGLQRQVRVEGRVEKIAAAESDAYFDSRPYESRIASAASPQSQVVGSREELEAIVEKLKAEHPDHVPRPANWGGYRLVPDVFEFWQGRPARLHDRFRYRREGGQWVIERLAP